MKSLKLRPISLFLVFVLILVFPSVVGKSSNISAQTIDQGNELANLLLQHVKNHGSANELWNSFSDKQKEEVQHFASQANSYIDHLENAGVTTSDLAEIIAKLPDNLALALQVSLIEVENKLSYIPVDNFLLSNRNYYYGLMIFGNNLVGKELWRMEHRVYWTSDGKRLKSARKVITPRVFSLGWEWRGTIKNKSRGGAGNTFYESDVQGHFSFKVINYIAQNKYPRILIRGYNDGRVTYQR